jgi:hypothetical protein
VVSRPYFGPVGNRRTHGGGTTRTEWRWTDIRTETYRTTTAGRSIAQPSQSSTVQWRSGPVRAPEHPDPPAEPGSRRQPAGVAKPESPMIGLLSATDPVDPSKGALNEKMPPSEATIQ